MQKSLEPHFSFTIPSIHDDTTLDCRIYHPETLSRVQPQDSGVRNTWRKRGIIMAHPYAPLGGCYDDRVVGIVVEEFLGLGYIVGTFNFRGAPGSKGRTSWSGKPEVNDYISFAGLFIHYLSYIRPHPVPEDSSPEQSPGSPQPQGDYNLARTESNDIPTVILGGYSHGSLILQHLPPVPSILQPFSAPLPGSAASEILLRARKLSAQSNLEWTKLTREHELQKRKGHANKLSVSMGGEETMPDQRRKSREMRRSAELSNKLRSMSLKRRKQDACVTPPEANAPDYPIQLPKVRYLLISPLSTPISLLAAPALGLRFWQKSAGAQEVVGKHMSLVVYGDQDSFSSAKKIGAWAEKLSKEPGSQLSHVEVQGAGHFWCEKGVEEKLRSSMREWEGQIESSIVTKNWVV